MGLHFLEQQLPFIIVKKLSYACEKLLEIILYVFILYTGPDTLVYFSLRYRI